MSRSMPDALADGVLDGLVDDAAIFPPGCTPVAQAVREHREHRQAAYGRAVGPLLVRAADAPGLTAVLRPGEHLGVALVARPGTDPDALPGAIATLRDQGRADVRALELPLSAPVHQAALAGLGVARWLEVARPRLEQDLDAVATAAAETRQVTGTVGAKLRAGGPAAGDAPSEAELARFLAGAVRRGLRVKLTAGLHHAVRNRDKVQGFEQHGVLNVLLATALLRADAPGQQAEQALAERDGARLAAAVRELGADEVRDARVTFASFGCCGVRDPLTELAALGFGTYPGPSRFAAALEDLP